MFRTQNRLANMKVDGQFYSELKQFEVDLSLLENKEDIVTGMEPGKMFRKRQGTNAVPAIREIQVSGNKPTSFEMDAIIDREIQRSTFISDPMLGVPNPNDTATADSQAHAADTAMLLNMANRIERHGLDRVAEMAFTYSLMYLDSGTRPNWSMLAGAPVTLDQMTRAQRKQLIGENYSFEFRGLSEQLWMAERARKIMEALGIVSQNPLYQAMVDIPKMFTDLMRSIGVESYVSPQAKQAYQMAVQQQMQSQQMHGSAEITGNGPAVSDAERRGHEAGRVQAPVEA